MTARPRLAIAAWLAALALCAWQVAQSRFVADLSLFLPAAPTPEQRVLMDQLREGAPSRVMLIGIEGGDAAQRARASKALAARLPNVANGAAGGFERERALLLEHRYALSPRVEPARFTVEGLRAAIGETIDLLASPAGPLVKPLATRDPTGEMVAILEGLRPAQGPRVIDGAWASADGERALLIARTRAPMSDTDGQAREMAEVEAAFAEARQGQPLRLVMSGPGVFSVKSRALVKHDVERLAAVSLALVAALLLAVYRSALALALGLVPVASGALAGVAAVSLGFDTVHGITLGFGTALIGEAVDYSIYLFVQAEQAGGAGGEEWVRRFWPTIRLGVLTSVAGFSAMLFSGLPGLAQLGVFSIAGLAAAALVTRFVLPGLLPRGFRVRDVSALGTRLGRAAAGLARLRWVVAVLALAAFAWLAVHRENLWDRELANLNPISAQDRALDAQLREALGASDARHMAALRAGSADAALAAAERLGKRLDALVAAGALAGYETPARFLPSADTQRARLASLPPEKVLRERLAAALAPLPLRPERLEPFLADVERARASTLLTHERLAGTALEAALDGLLFRDAAGRWTALIGLKPARGQPIGAEVHAALADAGPGALLLDVKGELDRLYAGYLDRAIAMAAVGLLAIAVLLALALRSAARVARVMAPLAAGVLVVAAGHLAAGASLSLLHLVGLLLVVAIGSNYALFFDRMAADPEGATPRTFASLGLANATTVAAFGVMGVSSVPVLHALGSTVALGAFATLAFAAMLARPR